MPGREFFQVGVIVSDLEAAMDQLSRAMGLHWNEPRDRLLGPWRLPVVFSREGPPFIELIEGCEGSPWDPAPGNRLDHLGYWSDDLGDDQQRLIDAGMPMVVDGAEFGGPWSYHQAEPAGTRIELLDVVLKEEFLRQIDPLS